MKRWSSSRLTLLALLGAGIIFFILFHERQLSGYDPASFALAIKYGYSVQLARPHGPGYPGFYLLWKAIEFLTHLSPHSIILAANLGFSLGAIALTYYAAERLYDERTAALATLFAATTPLFLYYENVTELYAYDAAFSAFLVLLLVCPPKKGEQFLFFLYGLLGAFRLSSVILTVPVIALTFWLHYREDRSFQRIAWNVLAIVLGTLAWLIPFVIQLGGWNEFLSMMEGINDLPTSFVENLGRLIPAFLWMVTFLIFVAVWNWKFIGRKIRQLDSQHIIMAAIVVFPLFFFLFKYYEKGYALLTLAPVVIGGTRLLMKSRHSTRTMITIAAWNIVLFIAVPFRNPSAESFLNHNHRTVSERIRSSMLRATSFFAPTLAHIRTMDAAMDSSESLIRKLPAHAYVLIDMSAAQWAYSRTLQVVFPDKIFLVPSESDSEIVRWFAADKLDYRFTWDDLFHANDLYYLTDPALSKIVGSPPAALMEASNWTALFHVTRDSFPALRLYNQTLFYRGR